MRWCPSVWGSARSATSRGRRIACVRTAATTRDGRSSRSKKSRRRSPRSRQAPGPTPEMYIAIDAAGGDFAPRNIVDGALVAARHLGFGLILVGDRQAVESELATHHDAVRVDVRAVDATDTVTMDEAPAAALRHKPAASVRLAAEAVVHGDAAAFLVPAIPAPRFWQPTRRLDCCQASTGQRWPRRSRPCSEVRYCWMRLPTSNDGRKTCCSLPRWGESTPGYRLGSPNLGLGSSRLARRPSKATS